MTATVVVAVAVGDRVGARLAVGVLVAVSAGDTVDDGLAVGKGVAVEIAKARDGRVRVGGVVGDAQAANTSPRQVIQTDVIGRFVGMCYFPLSTFRHLELRLF